MISCSPVNRKMSGNEIAAAGMQGRSQWLTGQRVGCQVHRRLTLTRQADCFGRAGTVASFCRRNSASWPFSIRRRDQLLHFCNAPRIFAMRFPHLIDPRNPRDYRLSHVSLSKMAKVFDSSERRLGRPLPVCIAGFNCGLPPTYCEGAPLCRARRGHNRGRRDLPHGARR